MDFQQELEALYKEALEQKKNGHAAASEALEIKAAKILEGLKDRVQDHQDDPEVSGILLYLAEREWPIFGDHPSVKAKLDRAIALRKKHYGPDHPLTGEALAKLAEFHFLAGRFKEAEPLYRESLVIFTYPKALEGLAQSLALLERPEEADTFFAQAIEKAKDDEEGKRPLYFLLISRADGLEKLKRLSEAAALRKRASALLPKANPGEFGFQV